MPGGTIVFNRIHNITKIFLILLILIFFISVILQSGVNLSFHRSPIIRECNRTLFPVYVNSEDNWGLVDREKTLYVISAYYVEERGKVFIIGARHVGRKSAICQFWVISDDNNAQLVRQTEAQIIAPTGRNRFTYTSTILTCSVHSAENATHVSLVKRPCDNPLNLLRVRDVSKPVKYGRRFTVCLSPMHTFDAHFRFIEWIELNRIIGAEKILIYNYSSGVNVENVIKHYVSKGLVEIVQWKLPFSLGNIEYFAQKAALNDCIFRNKNISEFIVNIDKDEFIIPHSKDVMNWSQMIEQFDKNYAAYLFRNSFYRTDWFNTLLNFSGADIARNFSLVTLTHVEREKKIFAPTYRSKYIARSAFVEFGNIHEVPRGRILNVPPEVGLLHHYRKEEHDKAEKKFKDLTVLVKFGHRLIQNVKQAWQEISKSS